MNTLTRPYEPGDEVQINRLYLSITGRDRSPADFAWEWLETWAGRGSMDLVFDLDRDEGDQLIAQYSLIPTPLSLWGSPTVAGKTENCMCHPDYRRSGLYSAHERESFAQRKKDFSFFFTTAGQVTNGAVGKVRTKMGYTPFDDWANYTIWLHTSALREDLHEILSAKSAARRALAPALSALGAPALQLYSHARRRRDVGHRAAVHAAGEAPLDDIAALWRRNSSRYGISVDRTAAYLHWRLDEDPHLSHEYITLFDGHGLLGYVVYFVQGSTLHVVDILVEGVRVDLFRHLIAALLRRARERGVERVRCLALRRSVLLPALLGRAGFIDTAALSPASLLRTVPPRQFFLYIPERLKDDPRISDHANWYVTELVLEGLPRPTSRP